MALSTMWDPPSIYLQRTIAVRRRVDDGRVVLLTRRQLELELVPSSSQSRRAEARRSAASRLCSFGATDVPHVLSGMWLACACRVKVRRLPTRLLCGKRTVHSNVRYETRLSALLYVSDVPKSLDHNSVSNTKLPIVNLQRGFTRTATSDQAPARPGQPCWSCQIQSQRTVAVVMDSTFHTPPESPQPDFSSPIDPKDLARTLFFRLHCDHFDKCRPMLIQCDVPTAPKTIR